MAYLNRLSKLTETELLERRQLGTRALAMLLLYVLGFIAAIATAKLLKSSILKSTSAPFVLELPEYRWPTLHSIGLRLIDRGRVFLQQAGTDSLRFPLGLGADQPSALRGSSTRTGAERGRSFGTFHRTSDPSSGI